jgi:predicted transposase/invertase (TIGR01784 family)
MTKLKYTFKHDLLFKMLFTRRPDLLKHLIAELIDVRIETIGEFKVTNPEIPPESLGTKFCRLDVNMTINDRRVDLEIQVEDEGDFPERSLFYWAREYSSALESGGDYSKLPPVIIVSIVDFKMFDCEDFHSHFQALEVSRHELLTDRLSLHYFELPKLPKTIEAENKLKMWLALFKANTEEELIQIENMEANVIKEAIETYKTITANSEFKELERLLELAKHNEASALRYAREEERKKWQKIISDKDNEVANKEKQIAEMAKLIEELLAKKEGITENTPESTQNNEKTF